MVVDGPAPGPARRRGGGRGGGVAARHQRRAVADRPHRRHGQLPLRHPRAATSRWPPRPTAQVVAGAVVDPLHGDVFAAARGHGATRNGRAHRAPAAPRTRPARWSAPGSATTPSAAGARPRSWPGSCPQVRDVRRVGRRRGRPVLGRLRPPRRLLREGPAGLGLGRRGPGGRGGRGRGGHGRRRRRCPPACPTPASWPPAPGLFGARCRDLVAAAGRRRRPEARDPAHRPRGARRTGSP